MSYAFEGGIVPVIAQKNTIELLHGQMRHADE